MIIQFLTVLIFVFIAIGFMSLGLFFSKYKHTHKRTHIVKKKKISVTCAACPSSINNTCSGH